MVGFDYFSMGKLSRGMDNNTLCSSFLIGGWLLSLMCLLFVRCFGKYVDDNERWRKETRWLTVGKKANKEPMETYLYEESFRYSMVGVEQEDALNITREQKPMVDTRFRLDFTRFDESTKCRL